MAVVPTDVARHYAQFGMVAVVPCELSCRMDSFGLITRRDWLLSPAAHTVLNAVKTAATQIYAAELG
jgi:DNA-binding transcriptional LysR family regulator